LQDEVKANCGALLAGLPVLGRSMGLQHIPSVMLELLLPLGRLLVLLVTGALILIAFGLRLRQTMTVPAP